MKRKPRLLISIILGAALMAPADMLLIYLGLPQLVRIAMMAALGWMLGTELGKWINKAEE